MVGNGYVCEWRGVLRRVILEAGIADGVDGVAGRLLDRVSVLRVFGVDVRFVLSGGLGAVLVLCLDIGVGVEYPESEQWGECGGVEGAVFSMYGSWASRWVS